MGPGDQGRRHHRHGLRLSDRALLFARKILATNRQLTDEARAECWQHIIDAREWFLKLVVKDFASEISQLEQALDAELS